MFEKLIVDDLGKKLKSERLQWGMSQRRLAKLSFTDKETICEIENGIYYDLDFKLLVNICDALQVSAFSFLKEGVTIQELLDVL